MTTRGGRDADAVAAVVARLERAHNDEDVAEYVGLFHPDLVWTTGDGTRVFGRDAMAEHTRRELPGAMAGARMVFEIEHLSFLRPDIAVVKIVQTYVLDDGGRHVGTPVLVLARDEDGTWSIAVGQNTGVIGG